MNNRYTHCLIATFLLCSPLYAGELETKIQFLKSKDLGVSSLWNLPLHQDDNGNIHVVYVNPRTESSLASISYPRYNSEGEKVIEDITIKPEGLVQGIEVAPCRDYITLLLYHSLHSEMKYVAVDSSGGVLEFGRFEEQWSTPSIIRAPDGNAILIGSNPGTNIDKTYNLPVLWEQGDAKLYAFSTSCGRASGVYGRHMPSDSSVYIFTHPAGVEGERYWPGSWDQATLIVFNYNTWLGHIVDSTIISLPDNSDLIASDIPFEGIRVRNDQDGNMLVFASYIDKQSKQHLRIFALTPDLQVLSPPKLQMKSELADIDLPKGSNPIRIFWYEHDRWGVPLRFHEIAVVGDTLYHSKLFDTGIRSYE